jgi:linearmycin/streptolysin S transport system ATP-binding protein
LTEAAVLRLEAVHKRYGDVLAVDGLDLEVRAGEILGLLGPNGAGKTTTVALATGLLMPDAGRVDVAGLGSPARPEARRRLGVAPQALALYETLTGAENLAFFGSLHGLSGRDLDERVGGALAFVGLSERGGARVATYSGGMKRRLNLAAALVHDPLLVLLDEPTAGVDPQSRNLVFENVLELRHRGRAILYTTHYMEEAARLCDRVAIVDRGRLLAEGTVEDLVARHGGKVVLVAETVSGEVRLETDDPLADLQRLAARERVSSFRVERFTLEQVFLQLTGRTLRD